MYKRIKKLSKKSKKTGQKPKNSPPAPSVSEISESILADLKRATANSRPPAIVDDDRPCGGCDVIL